MNSQLSTFLESIDGNWMSQKTTYYLVFNKTSFNKFNHVFNQQKKSQSINNITTNIFNLNYYNSENQNQNNYLFIESNKFNSGCIEIYKNKKKYIYSYCIIKNNFLKIEYTKNSVEYIKYIQNINKNLSTGIELLRKSGKYIAVSFSSNIRIKKMIVNK